MEKDINTEVSNTQLPATEEKANLKESLRIQKSQWTRNRSKGSGKRKSCFRADDRRTDELLMV